MQMCSKGAECVVVMYLILKRQLSGDKQNSQIVFGAVFLWVLGRAHCLVSPFKEPVSVAK